MGRTELLTHEHINRVDNAAATANGSQTAHVEPNVADLGSRLEHLDQKANQLKVQFALGKLSPTGYRHMLAKIDDERSRIETEIIDLEENR